MLCWKAIYGDGTVLGQFNSDGSENKYTDIDRTRLSQFLLLKGAEPIVVIHLDANKKLICRRRVAMHVTGKKAGTKEVVWLAGWQENRKGVNVQMISFVFEDGHIEVVDRFYENHPWFYPINFLPEERIGELDA